MIMLIMGPQGSGKGTQAGLIAKEYGVRHVSMGDILREEAESETDLGRLLRDYMKEGRLIPDEINDELVRKVVENNKDLLLDGYPRNLHQAEHLMRIASVDCVIVVNIGDEEAVKRIGKRRICTATKKIFIDDHVTEEDVKECEAAGGKIVQREDDTPEAVRKRLQIFHENTSPLIDFFREKGVRVVSVNGEQMIESVFSDIKKGLGALS